MSRLAALSAIAGLALAVSACGGGPPSEATIYYDPALRPGVVAASEAEREVLARLGEVEPGQPISAGGETFAADAPYYAASGRRCRTVRGGENARLACETEGGWVFVPEILAGEQP